MKVDRRTMMVGAAALTAAPVFGAPPKFPSKRPRVSERRFTSSAVEAEMRRVGAMIGDPEIAWLFANCYPNTLDTTVKMSTVRGRPDAFVITGDIPCMWLRDSSALSAFKVF